VESSDLEALGLYDPDSADADVRLGLLQFNLNKGVRADDLIKAVREGSLAFVAGESLARPGERFTIDEAARRLGVEVDDISRVWRAAGFAVPPPGDAVFGDEHLEVFRLFQATQSIFGIDASLQLARVWGSALARIAEAEVSAFVHGIGAALVDDRDELGFAEWNYQMFSMLPMVAKGLEIAHRDHILGAIRRIGITPEMMRGADTKVFAIGFCDLVGFTALSQRLSGAELSGVVTEFEARVTDIVHGRDGRVVKLIGDEVMFVAADAATGCRIALALAASFEDHPTLPSVRAGLAAGDVLTQNGDYFGPVVNLASRIVKLAAPGSVVVPSTVRDELADELSFETMGPQVLKGFDEPVEVFTIR
jgi:class 3 adenylate cyclase